MGPYISRLVTGGETICNAVGVKLSNDHLTLFLEMKEAEFVLWNMMWSGELR